MSAVHVFTTAWQPMVDYVDTSSGIDIYVKASPRARARCGNCNSLRWAKNIRVKCYYDQTVYRCVPGLACKRERARRSVRRVEKKASAA